MPPSFILTMQLKFVARDGTEFEFERRIAPPIAPNRIEATNKQYRKDMKVRVRNARYTNEYNCHGLTFAAKLGWFYDVRDMLKCHDYIKIGACDNFDVDFFDPNLDICRGDIVVYYNGNSDEPTHTGLVWSKRTVDGKLWLTILSKWGNQSEYFHRHDRVPVADYGKSIEVWTDRDI